MALHAPGSLLRGPQELLSLHPEFPASGKYMVDWEGSTGQHVLCHLATVLSLFRTLLKNIIWALLPSSALRGLLRNLVSVL